MAFWTNLNDFSLFSPKWKSINFYAQHVIGMTPFDLQRRTFWCCWLLVSIWMLNMEKLFLACKKRIIWCCNFRTFLVTIKRCVIVKRKGVIWHFFVVSQIFVSERQKNFDICFSNSSENSEMRRWHENFLKKGVDLPKLLLLHLYLSKMKPLWSKSLTGLHASHLLEDARWSISWHDTFC